MFLDKVKRNIVLTMMKYDVLSFEPLRYIHTIFNKDNTIILMILC